MIFSVTNVYMILMTYTIETKPMLAMMQRDCDIQTGHFKSTMIDYQPIKSGKQVNTCRGIIRITAKTNVRAKNYEKQRRKKT